MQISDFAEKNGYTIEEFIAGIYGPHVTIDVVSSFYERVRFPINSTISFVASYNFTQEEYNTYLSHPDDFYCVDYISYSFDEDKDENARARAEELAAKQRTGFQGLCCKLSGEDRRC